MAPEQLKSGNRGGGVWNGHDKMVDWWSWAVLLYELLGNATPFQCEGMHDYDTQDAIMIADYKCPEWFPDNAKDLIDRLLVVDVTTRLGYPSNPEAILNHAWFTSANFEFDKLRRKEVKAPWTPTLIDPLDATYFYEYDEEEEKYEPYRNLTEAEQEDFAEFPWI